MTDERSPNDLERDAERVRAQIADTTEHLKDKMSPGQLMDEVVNYFKDGDTNQLVTNLKHQVRDNPLALALVGGGLAWLMMGSGSSTHKTATRRAESLAASRPPTRPLGGTYGAGGYGAAASSASPSTGSAHTASTSHTSGSSSHGIGSTISKGASGLKDTAGSAAGKVSGAASSAADAASSAADSVSRTMHDLRDEAGNYMEHASEAGRDMAGRAKSTFLDALEREPLVIGALGVAVGAAIGAMLPATRTEQDYLGPVSAQARQSAESAVTEGIDKAKHVASEVYSAARDEADKQGLMPGDKPLAEKVSNVAKAAGNELKSAADQSMNEAERKVDRATDNAERRADKTTDTTSPGTRKPGAI